MDNETHMFTSLAEVHMFTQFDRGGGETYVYTVWQGGGGATYIYTVWWLNVHGSFCHFGFYSDFQVKRPSFDIIWHYLTHGLL